MNPKFLDLSRPYVIAEIGGNHEGDFEYALRLIRSAGEASVSAIKFQSYYADKIVSKVEGPDRNAHFRKFEFKTEQWQKIHAFVGQTSADFMTSIWDDDTLSTLDPMVQMHKVGSGDLTNFLLLKKLAETKKPIIIATAMSTLEEVKESVDFILQHNPKLKEQKALAVLHCVALYGNPLDEFANLSAIGALQEAFLDLPIGYSDHTLGIDACKMAVSMGCSVIEKHFTDDKSREFRDHHIAATAAEFKELAAFIDRYLAMYGSGKKIPVADVETPQRISEFRRAVYLKHDLPEGAVLTEQNLTTLRPNRGIDARRYFEVLGKKTTKKLTAFAALSEADFE